MTGKQTLEEESHHPLLGSTSDSLVRRHTLKKTNEKGNKNPVDKCHCLFLEHIPKYNFMFNNSNYFASSSIGG